LNRLMEIGRQRTSCSCVMHPAVEHSLIDDTVDQWPTCYSKLMFEP